MKIGQPKVFRTNGSKMWAASQYNLKVADFSLEGDNEVTWSARALPASIRHALDGQLLSALHSVCLLGNYPLTSYCCYFSVSAPAFATTPSCCDVPPETPIAPT